MSGQDSFAGEAIPHGPDPNTDPYQLDVSAIREPPQTLRGALPYLGPGFILSASIVGSGELIATTIVGAKAGFVLMWFIIFSCLIKVAVQIEFGKHAISSGESTMAALNNLPGPRLGNANWSIWTWLLLMALKMLQVGGIVGGVVLALEEFFPLLREMPVRAITAYAVAASVSLLVFRGHYLLIEKASLLMIGGFTLFTLASVCVLQTTDLAISRGEFVSGLIPNIPAEAAILLVAIGAFGITGVGGDEIMAYNYWLLEKGYARYTGPRDDSPQWETRAKGWIRVMYWDATLAMVAYTAMTVMFYLLGAAILNRQGLVPEDNQLIATLGNMYTQSLGPWARTVYVIGAVVVLYSTLFAALAAWTRMFSDAFARVGLYRFENERSRLWWIGLLAWVIPFGWATLFLLTGKPALMVILGGIATVVILLIVVFAAIFFRYRKLDQRLLPTRFYDATLWVSAIAIVIVAAFLAFQTAHLAFQTVTKLIGE
ncbi:MAG: Nramp family divalent metal transporter [Rubripirellula sp.]